MNTIETLIGIFTVDKGKIKILLMKKKENPYKGYWTLPGEILKDTLDSNIDDVIYNNGIPNLKFEQFHTYVDTDEKTLSICYMGLIDNITYNLKKENVENVILEWFDIDSIPKTAYNHNLIITELYNYFKSKIVNSNILRILFPSDFTLPEVQKIYEQVLNVKLDRRNFRKKLINLGYIKDTGDINEGYTGRPAKLYRFNEDLKETNLF